MDRYAEITFSSYQNAENEHLQTRKKHVQNLHFHKMRVFEMA